MTDVNGHYAHNIDAKGRLFIPTKLREELGTQLHITIGLDHCLSIYSDEGWKRYMEKLKEKAYSNIRQARMVFAYMTDCEPDAQGRVLIPADLRRYAGLEKEVVVAGIYDRVEVWNAQSWAKLEEEAFSGGDLQRAMEELGL